MGLSGEARRRWVGGICLMISAAMLGLGLTVLRNRMRPEVFVLYWIICMVMTGCTLLIALLDMRAIRMRSRREQTELVNQTLLEIQKDQDEKATRAKGDGKEQKRETPQ